MVEFRIAHRESKCLRVIVPDSWKAADEDPMLLKLILQTAEEAGATWVDVMHHDGRQIVSRSVKPFFELT